MKFWQKILICLLAGIAVGAAATFGLERAQADVGFPSWWSGQCDTYHFQSVIGRSAYALDTSANGQYDGVQACGPRPAWDQVSAGENLDNQINMGSGVAQLEFECVELVMRYMYLAYGQAPYNGNGKDVVDNYFTYGNGTRLVKIANGTAGKAPQPGDVVSYGAISSNPYGHTAIIKSVTVDGNGNGTITILNQNNYYGATDTQTVSGWTVSDLYGMSTLGWLHDPSGPSAATPAPTGVATAFLSAEHNHEGHSEVFVRKDDGFIWHNWNSTYAGNSWSGWVKMDGGGQFIGTPAFTQNDHNYEEGFARDSQGRIWHDWQVPGSATGWSGWISMGDNAFAGNVTSVRKPSGLLEIFARGTDKTIWHNWQVPTSPTGWSGWEPIAGTNIVNDPVAAFNSEGNIEIYALDAAGAVWHAWQVPGPGTGWSSWAQLSGGGFTGTLYPLQTSNGYVYLFATTAGGQLQGVRQDTSSGTGWSNWFQLAGSHIVGSPTASKNGSGVEVYVRNDTGALLHEWSSSYGGSWSGWYTLGLGIAGDPVSIVNGSGQVEIFAARDKTDVAHIYHDSSSSTGWGNWWDL
jgi:hypothetical protein